MQPPKALKRLHSIRSAEEHLCEAEMLAAKVELHRFEVLLQNVRTRQAMARSLFSASIGSEVIEDRLAALEESALLNRLVSVLTKKIETAEQLLHQARAQFLAKRIERRQAETLVEAVRVEMEIDENRRSQRSLDEWYRSRHS